MDFKDSNSEYISNKQNTPEIGNAYYIKRMDGTLCKLLNQIYNKKLKILKIFVLNFSNCRSSWDTKKWITR